MTTSQAQHTESLVQTSVNKNIGWLQFDGSRPLDGRFWQDLAEAITSTAEHDMACLVLTGGEDVFSVGNNLAWLSKAVGSATRRGEGCKAIYSAGTPMRRVARLLDDLPIVTVAVVSGDAIGAGLELACLTDLRICIGPAILKLPEPQLGVLPDLASHERLNEVLGFRLTRQLLIASETVRVEHPHSGLFADHHCSDMRSAAEYLRAISPTLPKGKVLPLLRRANYHAHQAEVASRQNTQICAPEQFRENIRSYVELNDD